MNHPDTVPELLFIRRASNQVSSTGQHRWSSHIAFPGGRHDASDESALYTALRETWEEIGMDLAEREFIQVGRLDEREITTSLGKRLLMILSPFGASKRSCVGNVGRAHASVPANHAVHPNTGTPAVRGVVDTLDTALVSHAALLARIVVEDRD